MRLKINISTCKLYKNPYKTQLSWTPIFLVIHLLFHNWHSQLCVLSEHFPRNSEQKQGTFCLYQTHIPSRVTECGCSSTSSRIDSSHGGSNRTQILVRGMLVYSMFNSFSTKLNHTCTRKLRQWSYCGPSLTRDILTCSCCIFHWMASIATDTCTQIKRWFRQSNTDTSSCNFSTHLICPSVFDGSLLMENNVCVIHWKPDQRSKTEPAI